MTRNGTMSDDSESSSGIDMLEDSPQFSDSSEPESSSSDDNDEDGDGVKFEDSYSEYTSVGLAANPDLDEFSKAHEQAGTWLLSAAMAGDHKAVRKLIGIRVDVNQNVMGETALAFAAKGGHIECVSLLLEAGAKVDTRFTGYGAQNYTALMHAADNGHATCVEMLIDAGADVNTLDYTCGTALCLAARKGFQDSVQLLIDAGADLNMTNANLNTCGEIPLLCAAKNNHLKCIQQLIGAGANVNRMDKYENTSLILAVKKGFVRCAEFLLNSGSEVNTINCNGFSALMIASKKGYFGIVELLIKAGAELNTTDSDGHSAHALQQHDAWLKEGKTALFLQRKITTTDVSNVC